jgi:phage tail-like protein
MAETGARNDPYRAFNYLVSIDGTDVAGFSEAGGLTFDTDPVEYRNGNHPENHVTKLSGLSKFANITLKRGITQDDQLWIWYRDVLNGTIERRSGSITLRDELRNDVLRWEFQEGWISKWEGPAFNATGNEVAIESIEICVERVELV